MVRSIGGGRPPAEDQLRVLAEAVGVAVLEAAVVPAMPRL
eukprot:COSAG01_NODE_2641_length_7322_cov_115.896456_4_plen_40_part_00